MSRIAVAVSGGIDSLCSLLMLSQAGHQVFALHGLFCPDAAPPAELSRVCAQAHVDLEIADLRPVFARAVMDYHYRSYQSGRTPNPCAICNREIKFGALLDRALQLGAEYMATGHYAALDSEGHLVPAADPRKDQAYFLSLVPASRLKNALFPLHCFTKQQTADLVANAGFAAPSGRGSQDICFRTESLPTISGPVLLRERQGEEIANLRRIGTHQGAGNYTIGQRRGLGIAWHEPLHVQAIVGDVLVVAPQRLMFMAGCRVGSLNFFLPFSEWPGELYGRFRYRQKPVPIRIETEDGHLQAELLEPRFTSAPGQVAAIYDKSGRLLAGGIVEDVRFQE